MKIKKEIFIYSPNKEDILNEFKTKIDTIKAAGGIVRNKDSIIRGLNDVIKIERESKGLSAKLNDMILVSKFIIIGAYLRRESRGCHLRSDYQDTDKDFIKHFDIKYSEIDGYIKTILDSTKSEVDEKLVS